MKKVILFLAIVTSSISLANRNVVEDELSNIIGNYYQNNTVTLNNEEHKSVTNERYEEDAKSQIRNQIIEFASTKLGSPYVWGATGPNNFDCSGFVGYVFKNVANLILPRVSSSQATFKPKISSSSMKKGDLVFFETTGKGRISHVGIYMGNRQFIHASSGSKRVIVSSLDSSYYSSRFRWAINPFS